MKTRVIVTGEERSAKEFSRALSARGFAAISLETIRIKTIALSPATRRAIFDDRGFDYVLFSSARAVNSFSKAVDSVDATRATAYVAVGQATAAAMRKHHMEPSIIPARSSGRDMINAMSDVRGKRVLFPRASIAKHEPVDLLRKRGARVRIVSLYTTTPVAAPSVIFDRMLQKSIDYVIFLSPSSVAGFSKNLINTPRKSAALKMVAVAIGTTTKRAAQRAGFKKIIIPKKATKQAIIELLLEHTTYAA